MILVGGPLSGELLPWPAEAWVQDHVVLPVAWIDGLHGERLPEPRVLDTAVYRRHPLGDALGIPFAVHVPRP